MQRDPVLTFDEAETAYIGGLAGHVAEGLRTALLLGTVEIDADDDGPGIVLLDNDLTVSAFSPVAERWLTDRLIG